MNSEHLKPVTLGRSGDAVGQVWQKQNGQDQCIAYLKQSHNLMQLRRERDTLHWLENKAPVPKVLNYVEAGQTGQLRTSVLAGQAASDPISAVDRDLLIQTLALQLKKLHALSIENCHLGAGLDLKLAQARGHMLAGLVDETDFEPEYLGQPVKDLFQQLLSKRPSTKIKSFVMETLVCPTSLLQKVWITLVL